MDVFRRYLHGDSSHRRGISSSDQLSISLERRDSDNERSRRASRKSKGARDVQKKSVFSLMHLCIAIAPISRLPPCFSRFSNFVFAVRLYCYDTVRSKNRGSPSLLVDTFVYNVAFCFLSLSFSRSLRSIHERTRPSGRSNICPPIDLHCEIIYEIDSRALATRWDRPIVPFQQIAQFLSSFLKAKVSKHIYTLCNTKFADIRQF